MIQDVWLRLLMTVLIFVVVASIETGYPKRNLSRKKRYRWAGNLLVASFNCCVVRILLPWVVPVLVAQQAALMRFGLFNYWVVPFWLEVLVVLLLLDLLVYCQHLLFHRIPLLWRLHRMHHTDRAIDGTTALRFHPLEIAMSLVIKSLGVGLLGASVGAVLLFEVLLNGLAIFNHGNIRLPIKIDVWLRKFVVTPDMHRVHHSVLLQEQNHNFGFNLSCWDRFFGSYQAQPRDGHQKMLLGLNGASQKQTESVIWMLKQPFK